MKTLLYTVCAGFVIFPLSARSAPVMRDAATHDELALVYRKAEQVNPMKSQSPAKGADPSTLAPPESILASSDVLCANGNATLVPKRAILLIPKNCSERLKYQNGAKLTCWSQFYAQNRGWITTVEVSREQAEGNVAIAENVQKQMQKTGNLVVATYQGGPISVLPPKAPEATSTQPAKP